MDINELVIYRNLEHQELFEEIDVYKRQLIRMGKGPGRTKY